LDTPCSFYVDLFCCPVGFSLFTQYFFFLGLICSCTYLRWNCVDILAAGVCCPAGSEMAFCSFFFSSDFVPWRASPPLRFLHESSLNFFVVYVVMLFFFRTEVLEPRIRGCSTLPPPVMPLLHSSLWKNSRSPLWGRLFYLNSHFGYICAVFSPIFPPFNVKDDIPLGPPLRREILETGRQHSAPCFFFLGSSISYNPTLPYRSAILFPTFFSAVRMPLAQLDVFPF